MGPLWLGRIYFKAQVPRGPYEQLRPYPEWAAQLKGPDRPLGRCPQHRYFLTLSEIHNRIWLDVVAVHLLLKSLRKGICLKDEDKECLLTCHMGTVELWEYLWGLLLGQSPRDVSTIHRHAIGIQIGIHIFPDALIVTRMLEFPRWHSNSTSERSIVILDC